MTRLSVVGVFILLSVLGSIPARGSGPGSEEAPGTQSLPADPALSAEPSRPGGGPATGGRFRDRPESNGERELKAVARAYPGMVAETARRDGQWVIRIGEGWFSWTGGRLLPDGLQADWEDYAPYRFYDYPYRIPQPQRLEPAARQRLEEYLAGAEAAPPQRHEGFLGALYGAQTRGASEARLVTVTVLGHEVRVHDLVAASLRAVAADLEELRGKSPEVRQFFQGIEALAGYNWRPIAGTRSRSYHSYGAAVDLVPRSYGGKQPYWRWAMDQTEEWYALPLASRWMVPPVVVLAFERHGFVWGGKWFFFDTMHFEYRPEILYLSSEAARFGY